MDVKYKLYKLKNGMQVLLIPSDTTYSVTVSTTIKSGAALEDETNQGITHFVEHLALSSTEKWPTKEKLNEVVEFNGASYNGSTGKESLNYYINVPQNKVDFGLDFIHQVLYHSTFSESDVEQERTIITDEISKYEDNPGYLNFLFVCDKILAKKSSYTLPTIGSKEKVGSFSAQELKDHYKEVHNPHRILLTVVGNFNQDKIEKEIAKKFESEENDNLEKYPVDEVREQLAEIKEDNKTELALTSVVFKAPAGNDLSSRDFVKADLILKILSGPMSSRLKRRLRDKEGLLYHISASSLTQDEFGAFFVEYEIDPKFFEKALDVLVEELDKFYEEGLTERELNHYKEYVTNRNLVAFDNIRAIANSIKSNVFHDDEVLMVEDINKTIKDLTVEDANKFIKEYFAPEKRNFFAYGKVNDEMLKQMQSLIKN